MGRCAHIFHWLRRQRRLLIRMVLEDEAPVALANLVGARPPPLVLQLEQAVRVDAPKLQLLLHLVGHVCRLLVCLDRDALLLIITIAFDLGIVRRRLLVRLDQQPLVR